MENIETVVRERNKAYHLLETGETGERPGRLVTNPLGLKFYYRFVQLYFIISRNSVRKLSRLHAPPEAL